MLNRVISRFTDKTKKEIDSIYRESVFKLFSAIVISTPVDKGLLHNNWFVNFDKPSDKTTTKQLPKSSNSFIIRKIKTELDKLVYTKVVHFTNNLPYAERIEYEGYSKKAPEGMVRINTANWKRIVNSVIKNRGRHK